MVLQLCSCECGKLPYAQNARPIIVYRKLDVPIFVVTDYIYTDSKGKLLRAQTELRNIINVENYLTSLTNVNVKRSYSSKKGNSTSIRAINSLSVKCNS